MPRGHYPRANRRDYRAEIKRLDQLSRTRALTEVESVMLERFMWRVERKGTRRASPGSGIALARAGIKPRVTDDKLLSIARHIAMSDNDLSTSQTVENNGNPIFPVDKSAVIDGDLAQVGA